MTKVRIIGGGLTGLLAAFEAHRLGCRDIEIHEQGEQIGGTALPRTDHGLELRDRRVVFGGKGDPARALFEWHGVCFDDVEERSGSVTPGLGNDLVFTEGFTGPALASRQTGLAELTGDSLADRLRAYPTEIEQALTRFCRTRLGVWLDELHASAAAPLGIDRVYPRHADTTTLVELKRTEALYNELYAIPRGMGGVAPRTVGLPRDGFTAFFATCRRSLEQLGVAILERSAPSPRDVLAARAAGDIVVWTAEPAALFPAVGLGVPMPIEKSRMAYVFKARFGGPQGLNLQSFAGGAVTRLFVYESRGQALLTAECAGEAPDAELRSEVLRLAGGFGDIELGDLVSARALPREAFPTLDGVAKLGDLRARLAETMGPGFVAGGWDADARERRFADVCAGLATALQVSKAAPAKRRAAA